MVEIPFVDMTYFYQAASDTHRFDEAAFCMKKNDTLKAEARKPVK